MRARPFVLAWVFSSAACSTAELHGPAPKPDGGVACPFTPVIACDAGASQRGCPGEPKISPAAIAPPPTYPIGCRAYIIDADCSTLSSCSCLPDDAGVPRWACTPS